jgi:exodeoxyribonuclease III
MKIATWNVNSIRKRLDRVIPWLAEHQPDVLCVQETKVEDDAFPHAEIAAAGYHALCHGQKTYNGVALLSREPGQAAVHGFADGGDDTQARFLVASVGALRVGSVYVPNGQTVASDKFAYKLAWLARWRRWLSARADPAVPMALCGDINIAPDGRDVYDPEGWKDQVLCHPDERAALDEICRWGLVDVFRQHHNEGGLYSWWDYRQLSFPKNFGLRIDLILCTASLAARCTSVTIDRNARKGQNPSDHAPVIAEFTD